MTQSFRDLVEKLSELNDDESCAGCNQTPCICAKDEIDETITNQRLATTFDEKGYDRALRVFNKLKGGAPEDLNEDDRLEAAKLLKILIPSISSDTVFNTILSQHMAKEKEKEQQTVAANTDQNAVSTTTPDVQA
jgi:hypothetical protein